MHMIFCHVHRGILTSNKHQPLAFDRPTVHNKFRVPKKKPKMVLAVSEAFRKTIKIRIPRHPKLLALTCLSGSFKKILDDIARQYWTMIVPFSTLFSRVKDEAGSGLNK